MENSIIKTIREIASHLNCGENCYYNSNTNKLITIPQFVEDYEDEEFMEPFQDEIKKVKNHKAHYMKISVLESFESFKIMEKFIDEISEQNFKNRLTEILERKKPFRNFKDEVENSEYREAWFELKKKETEKIVENILKNVENGNY